MSVHELVDHRPQPPAATVLHSGSSIHRERQTGPHPHATVFSPDGRWLVVPDLGTDEVLSYPFDAASGRLQTPRRFKAAAGSGPRLVLFSRAGDRLILVQELSSTASSLAWQAGKLEEVSAAPTTEIRPNTAAGLRWHPSGALFAASNRGADTIQLFSFATASGAITAVASVPSGGAKPRDFDFSPCGRWMVVGNQDSDSLALFAIETKGAAPTLSDTGIRVAIATPTCVRFLAAS